MFNYIGLWSSLILFTIALHYYFKSKSLVSSLGIVSDELRGAKFELLVLKSELKEENKDSNIPKTDRRPIVQPRFPATPTTKAWEAREYKKRDNKVVRVIADDSNDFNSKNTIRDDSYSSSSDYSSSSSSSSSSDSYSGSGGDFGGGGSGADW